MLIQVSSKTFFFIDRDKNGEQNRLLRQNVRTIREIYHYLTHLATDTVNAFVFMNRISVLKTHKF